MSTLPTSREVFLASPWIPPEWVRAHGFTPRGWFARSDFDPTPLAAGVCAVASRALSFAQAHPQAAFVFATVCDQLRRTADAAACEGRAPIFLFNVPATWQTAVSRRMFRAELERLGRFLVDLGGTALPNSETMAMLQRYDTARARLRAASGRLRAPFYARALARFHWTGEVERIDEPQACPSNGVPLALVGGPATDGDIDGIEHAGGRVVLDASEGGERSLFPELPGGTGSGMESEDPLAALTEAYLNHGVDVFQRPNTSLYRWLGRRLTERGVRGIVLRAQVGCDLWRAEAQSLHEAFGLPVLTVEPDENAACTARETARLAAFIEMLE
jgi:benzoyl-CoA reductase/2-hydroxyglutaryl-CoA dehydratase subunit BcrC/BadD/HgdB